jgi:hypothetical protein
MAPPDQPRSSQNTVSLSYELDLWGRLGANYDVAAGKPWPPRRTGQHRTEPDRHHRQPLLDRGLPEPAHPHRLESIAYAQKTLELVRTQYRAGAVSRWKC